MNKIFFAPEDYNGVKLTSTSANHVANLAKELIRNLESNLSNLCFYNENLTLVGSSETSAIRIGTKDVYNIPADLEDIAKAKSLIAWIREALKAKEKLSKELSIHYQDMYLEANGLTMPKEPEYDHMLTEEEYYDSLTVKERNRYYELETLAAVIGKAIHPDGPYAKAREELNKVIQNPNVVKGNGRDTLIYNRVPSLDTKDVENIYFELQKVHREVQSELNSIKYKYTLALEASQNAVYSKYNTEYAAYKEEMKALRSKMQDYYNQETNRVMSLKIIIPNSLMDIYEQVSKLGK